jgi:hypothetical protein
MNGGDRRSTAVATAVRTMLGPDAADVAAAVRSLPS